MYGTGYSCDKSRINGTVKRWDTTRIVMGKYDIKLLTMNGTSISTKQAKEKGKKPLSHNNN